MSGKELEEYDVMEQVSDMVNNYILKGIVNPTEIAKKMGIKRAEVLVLLDHWHAIARSNEGIKDRATELILELDLTYSDVIKELYATLEDCGSARDRNTTLKNIADVTSKRQETFQRAGIYDDAAIADEMAEMEQKVEAVQKLLTSVAENFPETKTFIIEGIGKIMKSPVSMPTGETPVDVYVAEVVEDE